MAPTIPLHGMWSDEDFDSSEVYVDFLLPLGLFHQMLVPKDASIAYIKQALWKEIESQKIMRLQQIEFYNFECVNELAEKIEINDESRHLCDVRPFLPMLRLVESKLASGSRDERITNAQISVVVNKSLSELESITEPEVIDFRKNMRAKCMRIVAEKNNQDWIQKAMSLYPPELALYPELPDRIKKLLVKGLMMISVRLLHANIVYTLHEPPEIRAREIIQKVMEKKINSGFDQTQANPDSYVLKVCGLEEYLLGDYPISQYTHVRKKLTKSEAPVLIVVDKESIISFGPQPPLKANKGPPPPTPIIKKDNQDHLQKIGQNVFDLNNNFQLTVKKISATNTPPDINQATIRACIYHGGENMCQAISCFEKILIRPETVFNEQMTFDIQLRNIPRMARLCFLLYSVAGDRKSGRRVTESRQQVKKKDIVPLAWANIPIYDYKGILRSGEHNIYMWNITMADFLTEECLNPIGTVESNPQKEEAICLTVSFPKFSDKIVYYPSLAKMLETAAKNMNETTTFNRMAGVNRTHLEHLRVMISRDPLHTMHEQEKEMIWKLREECREFFPQSLPKLLACVQWDNYINVCIMQVLLQIWKPLEATDALELLDFQYADQRVRNFAVDCISKMSDSEICQYLLQLVQVLKYESYLECDLIDLLLNRAINNHKIGHYFFWLLRSEMHVPSVSIRFGLILEAYCRGNPQYIADLSKQVDALANLKQLSDHIKKCSMSTEKLKEEVKKGLEKKYKQSLNQLCCPLNPAVRFKSLKIDKCKPMDSKMRPLWLVWENTDPYGSDQLVMFKKGDDLRQDMLTLQILKIMDHLWQKENLDFRLSAYGCLSTGQNEGLIEVVTEARTLASIQVEFSNAVIAAFNKKCIYDWLKQQNPDEKSFNNALDEFMWSCAGYCVATYVLGVADRHSDNIMVRSSGQLFHIDFGHILGHFKSKFGVKRERVPFVLTSDFVYMIRHGDDNGDKHFKQFQTLCEEAFMILRRNSKFLIALFLMMMNTGIPEVSCLADIEHLRETLVPDLSEKEGLDHFRARFKSALSNSWKASINNMCHNVQKAREKSENTNSAPIVL